MRSLFAILLTLLLGSSNAFQSHQVFRPVSPISTKISSYRSLSKYEVVAKKTGTQLQAMEGKNLPVDDVSVLTVQVQLEHIMNIYIQFKS